MGTVTNSLTLTAVAQKLTIQFEKSSLIVLIENVLELFKEVLDIGY